MSTILRFIQRDMKDNFILILTVAIVSAPLFYFKINHSEFEIVNILGFLFFFFFTIYLSRIWNGVIGASLSREYLLSLPTSRSRMFWIMWARSSVGFFPLFCLIWFSRAELRMNIFHTFAFNVTDDLYFFAMLIGASWMFMMNLAVAQTTQSQMLISRKKGKLIPVIKFFARMAFDASMIFSWVFAFLGPLEPIHALILGVASFLYYGFKNRIAYIQWMWGVDAELLRLRR